MAAMSFLEQRLDELVALRAKVDEEMRRIHAQMLRTPPEQTRRSRHVTPDCGTESGYQWHRYRGEKCDECRAAHATHTAKTAARRRALKRLGLAA